MYDGKSILAIIPARGGSKGIARKNIKLLEGKPLIAWTIEASLKSRFIDKTVVSTEDVEIADISKKRGVEVPFLRPIELAEDDVLDLPVCKHTLKYLDENENFFPDIVVWLRPTCPLRRTQDINAAVEKLIKTGADCVRSVSLSEHHPYWMKRLEKDRLLPFIEGKDETSYYRRQLLPDVYRLNGAVDVVKAKNVLEKNQLFTGDIRGYVMAPEFSVDVDTELDFMLVGAILKKQRL